MNIYSVLDSDDDEKPKQQAKKAPAAAPAAAPAKGAEAARPAGQNAPKGNKAPRAANNAEFEHPTEIDKTHVPKRHHVRHGAKNHSADGEVLEGSTRKRQFERRSGTGRGREVSRDGAGKANWGNAKQEAIEAEKQVATVEGEEIVAETPVEEEAAPAIPEPSVFTLDEYERRRAEARANSEAFSNVKLREVTADFAGMKTKTDGDDVFIALGNSKQSKQKKEQRSLVKSVLTPAFTVAPTEVPSSRGSDRPRPTGDRPPRASGDRPSGDRPRPSGDRPRPSGDRPRTGGDKPRASAPRSNGPRVDISDVNAFPSL